MAAAREVAEAALRLIGAVAPEQTPTDAEMRDALAALNAMLAAWASDGIDLGLDPAGLTLSDELAVEPRHLRAIRFNLAVDLAPEFGRAPPEAVAAIAADARRAVQAAFAAVEPMTVDAGLLGSGRGP